MIYPGYKIFEKFGFKADDGITQEIKTLQTLEGVFLNY